MRFVRWFSEESDAKKYQKEHNGNLFKSTPRSRTKKEHLNFAKQFNFDPEEYKYSVEWQYSKGENEI